MKPLLLFAFTLVTGCYGGRQENKPAHITTSPDFDKGEYLYTIKKDSAFYYFNKVVNSSTDSLQTAMAYYYMALIQWEEGDYFGSQENLLESLKHLNEKRRNDYYCLASGYNLLGNNCLDLKNYNAAVDYFDLALKFVIDSNYKLIYLNNKAVAHQKKGEYAEAIAIYNPLVIQTKNDKKEYARVKSNLAKVKWQSDPDYPALPEFLAALKIRQTINDDWGLNASYAHLSDYYSDSRPDSALVYAHKMYEVAKQINSPDDELEALQKLVALSGPEHIKQYISRYQYLSDSIQTARNTAKNQFALIRYETEKSKSENLVLQKDNAEKRIQLIQQQVLLWSVLAVFISGIVISILWYKKRKLRMEQESRNAIREQQLKLSQKVHDVVANGLYRIMTELEHQPHIEKGPLMDKVEILYEQSRDISYEQPASSLLNFHEEIDGLLMSFATPAKISVVGNHKELWDTVNAGTKKTVHYVLQELMINMKKHSQAQNVLIKFEGQGNQIIIHYKDDGIGLPPSFQYGNGLTNTENRIKGIGGRIIFDRATTKGLKMQISFPIT